MNAEREPHGAWPSPITASLLVEGAASVSEVQVDGEAVWWAERRPDERGRTAVVRRGPDGVVTEVTPPEADVRTRVHEYGGGAWWVHDGVLVYSDDADGRLRRLDPGASAPRLLTPDDASRYADGRGDVWVRERGEVNELVRIDLDGSGQVDVVATGADFYACPRPGPDGRLAWIQWDQPDMPWDATELRVDGDMIAGGPGESVLEPQWDPEGRLHFISDRDGWWRLYRRDDVGDVLVVDVEGEVGVPPWVFGQSRYALLGDGTVVAAVVHRGRDRLVVVPPGGGSSPATTDLLPDVTALASLRAAPGAVVLVAGWHRTEPRVLRVALDGAQTVLRPARALGLADGFFPPPEPVTVPTTDGAETHALLYRPANPGVDPRAGALPPLIVAAHGGPTGAARNELSLQLRYWTSRGFAVVDVDYRGSTGYGRAYRDELNGRWGVADVDDCVAVARALADRGEVDPDALAIRGSSAGGLTVLAALVFHDVFSVGGCRYAVSDLEALATDTHKFEARYLDRLVGPYPEAIDVYRDRSPIHHVDALSCPVIILQGLEDRIVPPSQAEAVVAALERNGLDHEYVTFPDEGHGFRRAENIVAALEAELHFFGRILGFAPAPNHP